MRSRIDFGAFLPDQSPTGTLLVEATNVLPNANGYGPVKSFVAISDPLPEPFQGAASFISQDGTAYLIAGTSAGLYRFSAGEWGSLTATSTAGRWQFAQFADLVIAVNGGETKSVDLTSGTAGPLEDAPTGTSVAIAGTQHVVIGGAGGNRLLVRWCAFNDPTSWEDAVDQAGSQPMLEGGEVMGLASGEYVVILQRFALTRMSLTGDADAPFTFQQITNNFGCASKASIAQAGRTVFFLSDRGFMALEDGQQVRPIGNEKFDASFRKGLDADDYERIWSAVDPKRSLVFWGVPGAPGTVWGYNWVLDRAFTLSLPFAGLFSGYEASLTLEQVSDEYPDIDTMPYSLDDPRFSGGDPRLYAVDTAGRAGSLSGPALPARVTFGWMEPFGSRKTIVRAVWPISDLLDGVTISITGRQRVGGGGDLRQSSALQASGRVPIRAQGRSLKLSMGIAAGVDWTYAQGLELEADAGGER